MPRSCRRSTSSLRSMALAGSLVGWTWTWPASLTDTYPLPQRATSYSSLASCTLHARVVEVVAVSGRGRPLVTVLMKEMINALRSASAQSSMPTQLFYKMSRDEAACGGHPRLADARCREGERHEIRAVRDPDARIATTGDGAEDTRGGRQRPGNRRPATVYGRGPETGNGRRETIDGRMSDRVPAIRVLLLPKDTNAYGTIFGGVILANIDLASAIEARKVAAHRFVTRAMHEVEFHEPVYVGDIVDFLHRDDPDRPDLGDRARGGRG